MHPLVIPYAMATLLMLFGIGGRTRIERAGVWVAAWSALAIVLWGIVFRTVGGDTARYYAQFLYDRNLSYPEMLAIREENVLFSTFLWSVGQLSADVRLLTGLVVLLVMALLVYGLRRLLDPYETALLLFIYSAYPYLIAYLASGLKNGIALAFLLVGFVLLYQRRPIGWLPLLIAPWWHAGAWLVFPFLALHLAVFNDRFGYRRGLMVILAALGVATGLSLTGLNEVLMSPIQEMLNLSSRYDIYFMDAEDFNYRAGFRLDFTLFSLAPLFTYVYLKRAGYPLKMPGTQSTTSEAKAAPDRSRWLSQIYRAARAPVPRRRVFQTHAHAWSGPRTYGQMNQRERVELSGPGRFAALTASRSTDSAHRPQQAHLDDTSLPGAAWWLSLYLSLNIIYQLFAFAPFADRFAAFSWFILPLVIFMQCLEARSPRVMGQLMVGFALVNILLIQFYTGNWIRLD